LEILDLECNTVTDLWQLEFLSLCACLRILILTGNPICTNLGEQYFQAVTNTLPTLAILDDKIASVSAHNGQLAQVEDVSAVTNTECTVISRKGDQVFCGSPASVFYSRKKLERYAKQILA